MTESEVQQLIQIEAAKHGIILMRNNCGAFKDATGRVVRYGLGNESKKKAEKIRSSDLIGIWPFKMDCGYGDFLQGRFVAIEVKASDWNPNKKLDAHEQAQKNFIDFINSKGGIAGFCNSVESFKALLEL